MKKLLVLPVVMLFFATGCNLNLHFNSKQSTIQQSPLQTAYQAETSSWKSYKYSEYDSGILPTLTFKYPSSWNVPSIQSMLINAAEGNDDSYGGNLTFNATDGADTTLRFTLDRNPADTIDQFSKSQNDSGTPFNLNSSSGLTIERFNATRESGSSHGTATYPGADYYIQLPNASIILVTADGASSIITDHDSNGYSAMDKVLWTFSFAKQRSDWRHYVNPEFNFSLDFPDSWKGVRGVSYGNVSVGGPTPGKITFTLPTSDTRQIFVYQGGGRTFMGTSPLSIDIYDNTVINANPDMWAGILPVASSIIAQNQKYTVSATCGWNMPLSAPIPEDYQNVDLQCKDVLASFKFIQ